MHNSYLAAGVDEVVRRAFFDLVPFLQFVHFSLDTFSESGPVEEQAVIERHARSERERRILFIVLEAF